MKLKFDKKKFYEEVIRAHDKAMEYYHIESKPWTPIDTQNLYDSFDWETFIEGNNVVSIGRWYGFADESGKLIPGARSGYFNYGQYQWRNHAYLSEWGDHAAEILKGNMGVIIREELNK